MSKWQVVINIKCFEDKDSPPTERGMNIYANADSVYDALGDAINNTIKRIKDIAEK